MKKSIMTIFVVASITAQPHRSMLEHAVQDIVPWAKILTGLTALASHGFLMTAWGDIENWLNASILPGHDRTPWYERTRNTAVATTPMLASLNLIKSGIDDFCRNEKHRRPKRA